MRSLLVLLCIGMVACAQTVAAHGLGMLGTGPLADGAAELAILFPHVRAFSATLHLTEKDAAAKEPRTTDMRYFFREGKVRIEMDIGASSYIPAEAVTERRTRHTDRWIEIARADLGAKYSIYPELRAYAEHLEIPVSRTPTPSAERVVLGEEELDGEACTKVRLTVAGRSGKLEFIVWEAMSAPGFPLQIEHLHGDSTITLRFRDVKQEAAPDLFELPRGYRRFETVQDLLASTEPAKK